VSSQKPIDAAADGVMRANSNVSAADDMQLSPLAALHRAVIEKKSHVTPPSTIDDAAFAILPITTPQQCAVHASDAAAFPPLRTSASTLPLSHPLARPSYCSVSSTCCLPRASFWNLRCGCIFSALPDELLLFNVFAFLPAPELCTLAAVCTRWKFLSTDPMLWREVDLSKHAKVVDSEVFESVLGRVGKHVNTLKMCNLKLLSSEALQRLGRVHLEKNTNLQALHFCSIKAIDLPVLTALLAGSVASSLRELSLFGCVNVDDACVRLIRRACVRLADLSVRGCLKLTDAAFADDADEQLIEPFDDEFNKSEMVIEEVAFESGLEWTERTRSISSSSSVSSASSVSMSSSSSSSSDSLPGRFAYLTSLNVANCKLLTEAGLISIFRASPLLQKLNLHALNPTDTMLDILTSYCTELHTLHLSSANPFGGNLNLTDTGVEYIAARLPHMQCLNLQGSSRLTDACIPPLIARCRQLEKLNLGGCFKLTDAGVAALCSSESESKLTHVSLFQCTHLTDASVQQLADRLPMLHHLDIHSCAALTDASLAYLMEAQSATEIPPLQSLDDEDADAVPSSSSRPSSIVYRLAHLQSIDVGSCRKITTETVARMKQTRPEVAITHY
jgi:hypothetical protein